MFRLLPLLVLILCSLSCAGGHPSARLTERGKIHVYYYPDQTRTLPRGTALQVWKSTLREGPFAPLGKPIELGEFKTDTAVLLLTDDSVRLGDSYYYYIQQIAPDGTGHKITGVMKAVATVPLMPQDTANRAGGAAEANQPVAGERGPSKRRAEAPPK